MEEKRMLTFLSRHHPTYAQIETVKLLGFDGITLKNVIFPDTSEELEKMIDNLDIGDKIIALAAPTWVHWLFWMKEVDTIEFIQASEGIRNNKELYHYYFCKGLWTFYADKFSRNAELILDITGNFIPCPISIEEQYKKFGLKYPIQEGGEITGEGC